MPLPEDGPLGGEDECIWTLLLKESRMPPVFQSAARFACGNKDVCFAYKLSSLNACVKQADGHGDHDLLDFKKVFPVILGV